MSATWFCTATLLGSVYAVCGEEEEYKEEIHMDVFLAPPPEVDS